MYGREGNGGKMALLLRRSVKSLEREVGERGRWEIEWMSASWRMQEVVAAQRRKELV